jgi:hypothetical protein
MPQDFVPESFQNRHDWLKNISDEIGSFAADLDLDSGDVSAVVAKLAPLIAKYGIVLDRQRDLDAAVGGANDAFDDEISDLRRMFGEWRKKPGYNNGIGQALGIVTTGALPDPATIKPTLKAEAFRGFVRLSGRKNYAETVNLYMRVQTTTAWRLIGPKRKTFPFDDQTPLAQPGVAEWREYMAVPVIGDTEVGISSDIVPVLYGG